MSLYTQYRNQGFCVIPLSAAGIPLVQWSQYMTTLPTEKESAAWNADSFGLICGEVSDIVAIDIDTDDAQIIAQIEALAGSSPLKKCGSKGYTAFYKYAGEKSTVWKRNGQVVVELLSDKRITTIPPSPHRVTGKPYTWLMGDLSHELPTLPFSFIAVMNALFPSPARVDMPSYRSEELEEVSFAEAEDMLNYVSPEITYQEWIAIGMALKDEFGDSAFHLWDNWSAKGSGYSAGAMRTHWRSFNGAGYGIGTLVYFAQDGGWIKKYDSIAHVDWEIDLSYLDKKTVKERKQLVAHGLVGDIAQWITETASRPQPQLALGAALTFVGMVKGHKVETITNLRTNLLVMSIAPSGGGKDDPLKAIDILADAVGLSEHLLSEPTAGTSLLKGLKTDAGRVGLWAIDEFGRYLAHVTSKNSGNYQKEIIDYVIKMFGRASGTIRGKKFANEKMNPRINIVNPHLCVIGASVKEHITDNCTSKDAIDGFLNRWILFESLERPRMKLGKKNVEVPQSIIDAIQKIIADDPNGKYPIGEDDKPLVRQVRYTPEAYAMVQQYQEEVENLVDNSPPILQALYTRNYEHTTKIALILSDDEFIRVQDLELAIAIVAESNKLVVDLTGLISDNEQEKMVHKLLAVIKAHAGKGGITHSELIRRSKFLNAKSRKEILSDLVQSGEVIADLVGKSYIYR